MSYDMALYHRGFLKRAVETGMGDWTGADPISDDIIQAVFKTAEAAGFVRSPLGQAFIDFARQEGFEPGVEFLLNTPALLAQLTIFPGQIAFSIPYGPRSDASIDFCNSIARRLAAEHGLGFHDPQVGAAIYE